LVFPHVLVLLFYLLCSPLSVIYPLSLHDALPIYRRLIPAYFRAAPELLRCGVSFFKRGRYRNTSGRALNPPVGNIARSGGSPATGSMASTCFNNSSMKTLSSIRASGAPGQI